MKKKTYCCSGILLAGMLFFAGCGNEIPEMNEEERSMVVNYAADIVQKYDSNHLSKFQMMTPLPEESILKEESTEKLSEEEMLTEQENDFDGKGDSSNTNDEVAVIDNTEENTEKTLDEAIMYDGFHFSYEGYETDESYPSAGTESYFAMNATEDNVLLVLKFSVSNQSRSEQILDMLGTGIRFKIQIDGETKNALTTMLLNDFTNYKNVVASGESIELVTICEIPKESAENISSLALIVKNEGETATISLH